MSCACTRLATEPMRPWRTTAWKTPLCWGAPVSGASA